MTTYYIVRPKDWERCKRVLRGIIKNDTVSIIDKGGRTCISTDGAAIYVTDRIPLNGVELEECPEIVEGERVLHYRSRRVETIKEEAIFHTPSGWEDCVIYGNEEGMTFVREKSDFLEAFVGIKENRGQ